MNAPPAGAPRVLLVDDDPSIRRFVALALEEQPLELIACASVAEALAELRRRPVELLLTDLMMPGETGLDLLARLADEPALRGTARVVVFSAGLNAAMQARLAGFDVWRLLAKPISVLELEACVHDGLALAAGDGAPRTAAAAPPPAAGLSADEAAAVERHFGGDAALFVAFRDSCREQFGADLRRGDAAVAAADAAALRLLAHSLKSVLATLGHDAAGATARQLEAAAAAADWPGAGPLWWRLRATLAALAADGGAPP